MFYKTLLHEDLNKEIDLVLEFLVINPAMDANGNILYSHLFTHLQSKIIPKYLLVYLEKLHKDNCIYYDKDRDLISVKHEGIIKYLEGGYTQEKINADAENIRVDKIEKNQKAHRRWMTGLTIILSVGTTIAAVYYWIQIFYPSHCP